MDLGWPDSLRLRRSPPKEPIHGVGHEHFSTLSRGCRDGQVVRHGIARHRSLVGQNAVAQIGREEQQAMLFWSKHPSRHGGFAKRNGHHMAEVGVGRLKLQFSSPGILFGAHIKHSTQLGIAMGVGLNRSSIGGTHHRPCLLDVNLEAIWSGPNKSIK